MTKEELLARLRECEALSNPPRSDEEMAHGMADEALLEFIGDSEIRQAFNAVNKWYA